METYLFNPKIFKIFLLIGRVFFLIIFEIFFTKLKGLLNELHNLINLIIQYLKKQP